MNPAEEIVKFWLQQNGYFVQSSIKVGRKEIDILAVHILNPSDKKHVEVQVSTDSMAIDPPEVEAREYNEKKFEDPKIKEKIHELFGGDFLYTKVVVKGEVRFKGKDVSKEYADECGSFGIEVIPFSTVMKDVTETLGPGTQHNYVIKTVQLYKKFLCGGH